MCFQRYSNINFSKIKAFDSGINNSTLGDLNISSFGNQEPQECAIAILDRNCKTAKPVLEKQHGKKMQR